MYFILKKKGSGVVVRVLSLCRQFIIGGATNRPFLSNLVLIPIVINTKYRIKSVEQHAAAAKKKEEVRRTTTLHTLFFRYRTVPPYQYLQIYLKSTCLENFWTKWVYSNKYSQYKKTSKLLAQKFINYGQRRE